MTYDNKAVTGSIAAYSTGNVAFYYTITSNGVNQIAQVFFRDPSIIDSLTTYSPQEIPNMQPGQSIVMNGTTDFGSSVSTVSTKMTFIGFETITLKSDDKTFPDKTFSNTCHFQSITSGNLGAVDMWVAPGYGQILGADSLGAFSQYAGDL
jgi:hypothetical protein